MKNVLIMVHNQFFSIHLKNIVSVIANDIVIMPCPDVSQALDIEETITNVQNISNAIDIIIVEANYGFPGKSDINERLFEALLNKFPKSELIALSGTAGALAKALAYDLRVSVMSKDADHKVATAEILEKLPGVRIDTSRFMTISVLKEKFSSPRIRSKSSPVLNIKHKQLLKTEEHSSELLRNRTTSMLPLTYAFNQMKISKTEHSPSTSADSPSQPTSKKCCGLKLPPGLF